MAVDVAPAGRDAVPAQAYTSKLYTAEDIEAMVEMLKEEPVLLSSEPASSEGGAKSRARTLRRYLAEYGVQVTSRTWPEFNHGRVEWRWCVMLREEAT
jgi:hypothetical protein